MSATQPATRREPTVVVAHGATRDEWLAARRDGVGGSDVAAIAGMSRWGSPLSVYYDKRGEVGDIVPSERMQWGVLLEDVIADEFTRRTGIGTHLPPGMLLAHPEHPRMLASPDRLGDDLSVVEVKTGDGTTGRDWQDGVHGQDGNTPDHYVLQLQQYLEVCDRDHGWLVALIGGNRLVVVKVLRDRDLGAALIDVVNRFWQRVEASDPPPADSSEATSDLLTRLWQADPASIRVLDPAVVGPLLDQRRRGKAAGKAAEAMCVEAENRLKQMLGEATVGVIDGEQVVTWKPVAGSTFTVNRKPGRRFHVAKDWD